MSRLLCRLFGHRLRMAEFDPITITHAWHCDRCGLHGWPGPLPDMYPLRLRDLFTKQEKLRYRP